MLIFANCCPSNPNRIIHIAFIRYTFAYSQSSLWGFQTWCPILICLRKSNPPISESSSPIQFYISIESNCWFGSIRQYASTIESDLSELGFSLESREEELDCVCIVWDGRRISAGILAELKVTAVWKRGSETILHSGERRSNEGAMRFVILVFFRERIALSRLGERDQLQRQIQSLRYPTTLFWFSYLEAKEVAVHTYG